MLCLEDVSEVLALYAKALTGRSVELTTARPAGRWDFPVDDGEAVLLNVPPTVDCAGGRREDFEWYKVLVTHQAGHLECGTDSFRLDHPSVLFEDLPAQFGGPSRPAGGLDALLGLVDEPLLMASLVQLCEDFRVDSYMSGTYPGLAPAYRRVAGAALRGRPDPNGLPAREAFVELLVRHTLGADYMDPPPTLGQAFSILERLRDAQATVQDAVEAALRLYAVASAIPNVLVEGCDHDHEPAGVRRGSPTGEPQAVPPQAEQESQFRPPQAVGFRSPFETDLDQTEGLTETDLEVPLSAEGALLPGARHSYLYPEWDFRSETYRDRWCRVYEERPGQGSSEFHARALREHRGLVLDIEQRFQHLFPELFRRRPRQLDGEDVDLDSLIELVVDRCAGVTPSEKIYWRRERIQRDVAVAVLLDMSATTAEYIVTGAVNSKQPPSAAGYSERLRRIAQGLTDGGKPLRKQVLQIEKEAAIVLMHALERIGDSYALYAFSGSGRDEVQFLVAKDFDDPFDQRVAKRLDALHPAHATRMGAAIRHAVHKFKRVEAQTRLLVVVSDGRPYDRDYGRAEDRKSVV